jgi:hypothetical protein
VVLNLTLKCIGWPQGIAADLDFLKICYRVLTVFSRRKCSKMGNIDSVPVLAQAKSLVQVIGGDAEGAKKTQENFFLDGFITSQVSIPLLKRCVC